MEKTAATRILVVGALLGDFVNIVGGSEFLSIVKSSFQKALAALHGLGLNPPEEALSKEHWEAIRKDVEAQADWWDSHKWGKGEKGEPK